MTDPTTGEADIKPFFTAYGVTTAGVAREIREGRAEALRDIVPSDRDPLEVQIDHLDVFLRFAASGLSSAEYAQAVVEELKSHRRPFDDAQYVARYTIGRRFFNRGAEEKYREALRLQLAKYNVMGPSDRIRLTTAADPLLEATETPSFFHQGAGLAATVEAFREAALRTGLIDNIIFRKGDRGDVAIDIPLGILPRLISYLQEHRQRGR